MSLLTRKKENGEVFRVPSILSELFDTDRYFPEFQASSLSRSIPSVNIRENNNEFLVELAAPGMKKEDFKVNVENNTLTISAEKEESKEEKEDRFTRKEYSYNSFSRSFTLPEYVKSENIDARYENGVLKLTLPKKEEARKKPVKEIKVS